MLSTSCFLDNSIPILGVNSDPTLPEEEGIAKAKDERRSRGALYVLLPPIMLWIYCRGWYWGI